MQQHAYRPRSVELMHQGFIARIYFVWGHPANPIPESLYVSLQKAGSNVVLVSVERRRYSSYVEALDRGRQLAAFQIEHLYRGRKA